MVPHGNEQLRGHCLWVRIKLIETPGHSILDLERPVTFFSNAELEHTLLSIPKLIFTVPVAEIKD